MSGVKFHYDGKKITNSVKKKLVVLTVTFAEIWLRHGGELSKDLAFKIFDEVFSIEDIQKTNDLLDFEINDVKVEKFCKEAIKNIKLRPESLDYINMKAVIIELYKRVIDLNFDDLESLSDYMEYLLKKDDYYGKVAYLNVFYCHYRDNKFFLNLFW